MNTLLAYRQRRIYRWPGWLGPRVVFFGEHFDCMALFSGEFKAAKGTEIV